LYLPAASRDDVTASERDAAQGCRSSACSRLVGAPDDRDAGRVSWGRVPVRRQHNRRLKLAAPSPLAGGLHCSTVR